MLRYKAFQGADIASVESNINGWLSSAEPDVKLMNQSTLPSGQIVVSFLYDEGFMASEQRLTDEAAAIVEHAMQEQPILEPIQVDQEQV